MLDHAVIAVGSAADNSAYDLDLAGKDDGDDGDDDPTTIPYWVIKNSWGQDVGREATSAVAAATAPASQARPLGVDRDEVD